jgi:hypothetical protein
MDCLPLLDIAKRFTGYQTGAISSHLRQTRFPQEKKSRASVKVSSSTLTRWGTYMLPVQNLKRQKQGTSNDMGWKELATQTVHQIP